MSFMRMKLFSNVMKFFYLMIMPSQQFCLCGTLFNVQDTFMKHVLRLEVIWTKPGWVMHFILFF